MFSSYDKMIRTQGMKLWEESYKLGLDENYLNTLIRKLMPNGFSSNELAPVLNLLGFAPLWMHCGTPTIQISAKQAAGFLCSDMSKEAVGDLQLPWCAFRINLPQEFFGEYRYLDFCMLKKGLLIHPDNKTIEDGAELGIMFLNQEAISPATPMLHTIEPWQPNKNTLVELCYSVHTYRESELHVEDRDKQLLEMAKQLIVGTLFTLNHTKHWHEITRKSKVKPMFSLKRGGPPAHREFVIVDNVKVDCSRHIQTLMYSDNVSQRKQTIQCLVRGHYRNQACGPRLSERKLIWIEPFWRGPEESKIAQRDHVFQNLSQQGELTCHL